MEELTALLQEWGLGAQADIVVPAGVFLLVLLVGLRLIWPGGRQPAAADDDLEEEARRWIGDKIDEYVDVFAEAFCEAGAGADADDPPPGFATIVESFIADVLLHQRDESAPLDVDLSIAIREFVVLRRAELYDDVTTRTRRYLAVA